MKTKLKPQRTATRPGVATREKFLPFALPSIGEEEIAEVVDTLRSGWITTGPKVKKFEADFAAYVQSSNAIAVNSCTAGLLSALTAFNIGPGDEVIVPSFTFCASANVAVHLGASPKLVDIGWDFQIDPLAVEAAITQQTRAIMPVHFAGQACDLEAIYGIAARHKLAVVEDAAHAAGTSYRGRMIGSDQLSAQHSQVRRATAFSFYANKNMTTGEGGMITANDLAFATRLRMLSLHGMSSDAWKRYSNSGSWFYEVVAAGYKHNMTDIAAAIGIHQLRRLNGFIEARQRYAGMYDQAFAKLEAVKTPIRHADRNHVFHLYAIRLDLEQLTIDRATFIAKLKELNIGASVHFIPLHLQPFYQKYFGYRRGDLPRSEAIYDSAISLPIYPAMTEQDCNNVIEAVHHVASKHRR
jgi:dTDP-4-amino-4,6-dideoxygalactose transaminase